MEIEQACTNAGFVKGEAAQGKGLFKDCMQPIMHGQAVNGVTVDPAAVSACKERMAHRHHHGGQGAPNGQAGNPPGGQNSNSGSDSKGNSDESSQQ
jgi:hypothetical protein